MEKSLVTRADAWSGGIAMVDQIVRGPLLIPQANGSVTYYAQGAIASDSAGAIQFAGDYRSFGPMPVSARVRESDGVMMPPLLDIHTHIPQHPIRGRFIEGVPDHAPGGKLLAGLARNVFPTEARCVDAQWTHTVVERFLADTLSHGIVGGAAYMTPSALATEIALSILPASWSVGLVLMNQNCPDNLRTDSTTLEADIERMAKQFGRRLIVTDRFAVAVDSTLRKRGVAVADRFGLRTQTHLNEQTAEKEFVEGELYSNYQSYADVYLKDGLLNHHCIAAHCIHMNPDEWNILRDSNTVIAHCPTSNLLLGSGVMNLDAVLDRGIPYAIATDVGASPTVSMLAEMKRFMQVHRERSTRATAEEALYRSTRLPAQLLGIADQFGALEVGRPMSFIEVDFNCLDAGSEEVIQSILPENVDAPRPSVNRLTVSGQTKFERGGTHA